MKKIQAFISKDGVIFQNEDDCLDYEYLLSILTTSSNNNLTPREQEVYTLLTKLSTNKAIAECLGITERTVKAMCSKIYEKYNVKNKVELLILVGNFE